MNSQAPVAKNFLGSRIYRMSEEGIFQRIEKAGLLEEEYPEFIKQPYDMLIEKIWPRLNASLEPENQLQSGVTLAKAYYAEEMHFPIQSKYLPEWEQEVIRQEQRGVSHEILQKYSTYFKTYEKEIFRWIMSLS